MAHWEWQQESLMQNEQIFGKNCPWIGMIIATMNYTHYGRKSEFNLKNSSNKFLSELAFDTGKYIFVFSINGNSWFAFFLKFVHLIFAYCIKSRKIGAYSMKAHICLKNINNKYYSKTVLNYRLHHTCVIHCALILNMQKLVDNVGSAFLVFVYSR